MNRANEILIANEQQFKRVKTQWLQLKRQREIVRVRGTSTQSRDGDAKLSGIGDAKLPAIGDPTLRAIGDAKLPAIGDPTLRAIDNAIATCQAAMDKYVSSLQDRTNFPPLESIQNAGEWLVQARLALNLTQGGLAHLANMHRQQLHRYEQTQYQHATLQTLQQVSSVLLEIRGRNRQELDPKLFTPAERVRTNIF